MKTNPKLKDAIAMFVIFLTINLPALIYTNVISIEVVIYTLYTVLGILSYKLYLTHKV